MQEQWKNIEGFEELYQVSSKGRIRSCNRKTIGKDNLLYSYIGKVMSFSIHGKGYMQIQLRKEGGVKTFKVHRLVAKAFIPNSLNLPQVNHLDGDKSNNNDWNLEWSTAKNNIIHSLVVLKKKRACGEKCFLSKLKKIDVLQIRKKVNSTSRKKLATQYNVSTKTIGHIVNQKTWKHLN